MLAAERYSLSRARLAHLLQDLKQNSIEVASLCLPAGLSRQEIEGLLESLSDRRSLPDDLAEAAAGSPTGAMLFWGPHHRYLVLPPFPVQEQRFSQTCEIEPLEGLLNKQYLIGLILVRLGAYAIALVKGENLLYSKAGTGLVHARHRQGGSSSHRFERHRYKQMETFFTRVCLHAREQLEARSASLDFVLYGGARETILEFRKQCDFAKALDKKTLPLLLNVREAKQSTLHEAIQAAWSSRVIQWDER
jgi:peptide subunit release factor 1 (eRF1)